MEFYNIPLAKSGHFSSLFLDYILKPESLDDFYHFNPDLEGIKNRIESRGFSVESRAVLVNELLHQYEIIGLTEYSKKNIESILDPNTFVVTCGHQLNLFTGPLYFIYKIISTIKLANRLKIAFPDKNFVPIYWMATEDNDFEEINHFHLFGKKYTWEYEAKGAIGKLSTSGMEVFLETLPGELESIKKFYQESTNLAEATAKLVNELFGTYGLIVLDPDVKSLRSLFKNFVAREIIGGESHKNLSMQSEKLNGLGYKSQIAGREINLMYSIEGLRERIVQNAEGIYEVINTKYKFTLDQILKEIEIYPERFSTNVVLRPVYQETILPNVAFVGGPAEVVYWLQLKNVFEGFGMQMPVILPRNFAVQLSQGQRMKLEKLELSYSDLNLSENEIRSKIGKNDLNLSFDEEESLLGLLENKLQQKVTLIDKSLDGYLKGEMSKAQRQFSEIFKKLEKAIEKRNVEKIQQAINLKNKLLPEGMPQERHDNFLNFYLNDPTWLDNIFELFDPLLFEFYVVNL